MGISVRAYQEKDYLEMLDITMELWHLKMKPYTKKGMDINKTIIDDTGSLPKRFDEGILIAEVDGNIAGVAHLDFVDKKRSESESLPVLKLIFKYGLFRLLRVRRMGLFFKYHVKANELHVHGIVVSKKYRSMEVGSKLFSEIEKLAKNRNLNTITLEVLDTNIRASALYKKLGFKVIKEVEFNKKQQKYFKSKSHIYMTRNI